MATSQPSDLWLALAQGEGDSSLTLWPTHPSAQVLAPLNQDP